VDGFIKDPDVLTPLREIGETVPDFGEHLSPRADKSIISNQTGNSLGAHLNSFESVLGVVVFLAHHLAFFRFRPGLITGALTLAILKCPNGIVQRRCAEKWERLKLRFPGPALTTPLRRVCALCAGFLEGDVTEGKQRAKRFTPHGLPVQINGRSASPVIPWRASARFTFSNALASSL